MNDDKEFDLRDPEMNLGAHQIAVIAFASTPNFYGGVMKLFLCALLFVTAGAAFADHSRPLKDLCNVQVTTKYLVEKTCRVNDVMIGAEIQDGVLKVQCGHPIVLCNGPSGSGAGTEGAKPQVPQVAERWYCTGICYIIGDPEVDPHHKVSAYGPSEAAARASLKCDPDDISDVVCRQVEKK
jgi:hypothetical protein